MAKGLYSNYKNFLIKHQLFDNNTFNYIKNNSVLVDFKSLEDYNSYGCSTVLDERGRLVQVIPCVPFLNDDISIAINVFVYVEALILISLIGRKIDNKYIDRKWPFIFFKLYLLENKDLLKYQEKIQFSDTLKYSDDLIYGYCHDDFNLKIYARMIKRRAKDYLSNKKDI